MALLVALNALAGIQGKVAQFLSDVLAADSEPLLGRAASGGTSAAAVPAFKRGSHVE